MHPLAIPEHWSPEQALAVYDFLNDLAQQLWNRYQFQLIPLLQSDLYGPDYPSQLDLFEPQDDLPF